uniref:Chitinase n=1 Tax=Onchocerca volvulus TaxID=6282 RepID=Q25615_ONCVO|nr:chitinase [Onchocerca volvulus]
MRIGAMLIPFIILGNAIIAYGYVRGCYYTNWAQYRQGEGKFLPEDIPKGLCTHILYAFAKVDQSGTSLPFEWNDEDTNWSKGMYSRVTKLKENDPEMKILLSYGGYNFGSSTFTAIRNRAEKRKHFIKSAIAFLRKNKFDGFDFDWEYPIGMAQEYAKLVNEMKVAFVEEAKKSDSEQLLLTAAVSAGKHTIDQSYNVQSLGENFDLLSLMSYDFHGSWEMNVDLHAKLHPTKGETSGTGIFNTEFAANYWLSKGMPKQKIIIGIPTYGRGWTLRDSSKTTIGAEGISPSSPSTTNPAGGTAAYWEICKYLKEGGKETIDEQGVGACMVQGSQWYGYDNEETIRMKMRWLKEKGYGGAFIWTLDFDDFKGTSCGEGPYPLLSAINHELKGEATATTRSLRTTITQSSTIGSTKFETTTTASEITKNNKIKTTTIAVEPTGESSDIKCPESFGLFRHPNDCHLFIHCAHDHPYVKLCPPNTFFNDKIKVCDHFGECDE